MMLDDYYLGNLYLAFVGIYWYVLFKTPDPFAVNCECD